ncbi:MAG: CHAT domain-containing protein [Actinomycetia bacterium]|nr:CHAT domain-containing protein [Actinomycetes bacterium]
MATGSAAATTATEYAPTRSRLEHLLDNDPGAARTQAEALLDSGPDHPDLLALAWRIAGSADRELGELVRARTRLEQAIAVVGSSNQEDAMAQAALVATLLFVGAPEEAWQASELALPLLQGSPRARLRLSRAGVLSHQGKPSAAMAEIETAVTAFEEHADQLGLRRALNNRAIVRTSMGRYAAAVSDLERVLLAAPAQDNPGFHAIAQHNLGLLIASSGEIPRGLRLLTEADETLQSLELPHPEGHLDHAQLLLEIGLLPEALTHAEKARSELEARAWASDLPRAHHLLARVALASDNGSRALEELETELALLEAQDRPTDAAIALRHAAQELVEDPECLESLSPALEHLPTDFLLRRAQTLLRQDSERAREALSEIIRRNDRSSWRTRTERLLAQAELDFLDQSLQSTRDVLELAFREIDRNRWWLGVGEICAAALRSLDSMVDLSGRLAVATGQADDLIRGYESSRQLNRSTPAVDAATTALATRARGLSARLAEPDLNDRQKADLLRRLRSARAQLRRRSWGSGAEPGHSLSAVRPDRISRGFPMGAGVILTEIAGAVTAGVVCGASRQVTPLASGSELARPRRALSGAQLAALQNRVGADERFEAIVDELERQLIGPLSNLLPDEGPIVVTAADHLLSLPWGSLPSLRGRHVSLVPSLSWWCHAADSPMGPPDGGRVVLAAGPDLDHAEEEVMLLCRTHYPDATVLVGSGATATAVLDSCTGADVLHIAAHGRFRDDSPMFSSIELADGPLSMFELGQVAEPPARLILSTCDLGRHGTTPMARTSGLVHLLGSGWRSIAASTTQVLDRSAPEMMNHFHGRLRTVGIPAAIAELNEMQPMAKASLVAFGS